MNDLTVRNSAMPVNSIADMKEMADEVAKSGLLGACSPAKAFVIVQHCAKSELSLLEFKQRYHVTDKGEVTMKADRALAEFQILGGKCVWKEVSHTRAAALFSYKENVNLEIEFTAEEAKARGLIKPKSAWESDPGAMCRARVVTRGIRAVCPQAMQGMYSAEEVEEIIDVTEAPAPGTPPAKASPARKAAAVKAPTAAAPAAVASPIVDAEVVEPTAEAPAPTTPAIAIPDVFAVAQDGNPNVCPIKGKLLGKAWADMDEGTLEVALTLLDAAMTPAHFEAVNAALAAKRA